MNFDLDFKMIDDPQIKLTYFGEYLYKNIIFFSPTYNEGINSQYKRLMLFLILYYILFNIENRLFKKDRN